MSYFVYMVASKRNGTIYTGVTNDLARRAGEHKDKIVPGFTRRYGVDILVWSRKADQGLEPGLENPADREKQPGVERPDTEYSVTAWVPFPSRRFAALGRE